MSKQTQCMLSFELFIKPLGPYSRVTEFKQGQTKNKSTNQNKGRLWVRYQCYCPNFSLLLVLVLISLLWWTFLFVLWNQCFVFWSLGSAWSQRATRHIKGQYPQIKLVLTGGCRLSGRRSSAIFSSMHFLAA